MMKNPLSFPFCIILFTFAASGCDDDAGAVAAADDDSGDIYNDIDDDNKMVWRRFVCICIQGRGCKVQNDPLICLKQTYSLRLKR